MANNAKLLKQALDVLEQVEVTGSKRGKVQLLESTKSNPYLKKIISLSTSSDRFFVKKLDLKKAKAGTKPDHEQFEQFVELLNECATSTISGDAARDALSKCASRASTRLSDWFIRILEKNLRIGMDSSINKVFAGSVSTYGVAKGIALVKQKTGKIVPSAKKMVTFPCLSQPKRDGWNITFRLNYDTNTAQALSSSGKHLPALDAHAKRVLIAFKTKLGKLAVGTVMVTGEGEALYDKKRDAKHWKSVWGKTSAMSRAGMSKGRYDASRISKVLRDAIEKDLVFIFYDVYPESAHTVRYDVTYDKRHVRVSKLVKALRASGHKNFRVIDGVICNSWKELEIQHRKWMKEGQEGSIIRMLSVGVLADSKWRGNYVKWKETRTIDAVIIGVNPGTGRNKNVAGAFRLWLLDQKEEAKSNVLGDAVKKWAWKNKDAIIGYRVEVIAQQDNNGAVAKIRNPVIARYRDDQPPMSEKELRKVTGQLVSVRAQMTPASFNKAVANFMAKI